MMQENGVHQLSDLDHLGLTEVTVKIISLDGFDTIEKNQRKTIYS